MNISLLQQEAQTGNAVAQTVLGVCYLDGIDTPVDYIQAFRLLSAAADHRVPRAMANLGRMYAEGLGIPRDIVEAIRFYEAAAKAGEFLAQVELGRIYSRGLGVARNPDAALRWYSAAAAQQANGGECEEIQEARTYIANAR
jgi:TPR repeat protein